MEGAGLALGSLGASLGLPGLFTACTTRLSHIHLGTHTHPSLQTKFSAHKLRFLIWGHVCGLAQASEHESLEDAAVRSTIMRILDAIYDLLSMRKRYGMHVENDSEEPSNTIIFRDSYQRLQPEMPLAQQIDVGREMKWVVVDDIRFARFVRDFKELVDALDDVARGLQLVQRIEEMMAAEVEAVSDLDSLRLLLQALSDNETLLDAVSRRLKVIEEDAGTVSARDVGECTTVSFDTAPSQ
jgi:hypothetical protein